MLMCLKKKRNSTEKLKRKPNSPVIPSLQSYCSEERLFNP